MQRPLVLAALLLVAALPAQKEGSEAPDFTFASAWNFGEFPAAKLSELRGSVVLLEFWGTY